MSSSATMKPSLAVALAPCQCEKETNRRKGSKPEESQRYGAGANVDTSRFLFVWTTYEFPYYLNQFRLSFLLLSSKAVLTDRSSCVTENKGGGTFSKKCSSLEWCLEARWRKPQNACKNLVTDGSLREQFPWWWLRWDRAQTTVGGELNMQWALRTSQDSSVGKFDCNVERKLQWEAINTEIRSVEKGFELFILKTRAN